MWYFDISDSTAHWTTLHYTILLYYTTTHNPSLLYANLNLSFGITTALSCSTLHYPTLLCHILPSPTWRCNLLPFPTLYALHCSVLSYHAQTYTKLHYTILHYTTLHYTPLHFLILLPIPQSIFLNKNLLRPALSYPYPTLPFTIDPTLHYLTFPCPTLHYTILHCTTPHHT